MFYIIANENNLTRKNLKKLEQVKEVFTHAGKDFEIRLTSHRGHATEIAREITSDGKENTVIAMGGDGTLHEILNGFEDFTRNYLGLIPLGTGNDFAVSANIPLNARRAAEIIAFRAPQPIDFIQLSNGLRSINAIGMGVDVDVLKRAYASKIRSKSKYLRALLVSLAKFKSYNYTVKYDGTEETHFGLIGALGNGKQIGGGIKLFPEAEIDDGYLDLLVVDYISKRRMISAFLKLMRGKVNKVKEVTAIRTKAVTFIPHMNDYTVQAEGELYDNIPFEASISEGGVKFYLP